MCKIKTMLADLKTKQENGEYKLCPRCGLPLTGRSDETVKSKIADILICKECALQEEALEKMNNPGSVYTWYGLQPKKPNGDFKTVKGENAWERICQTQKDTIFELYDKTNAGENWGELNFEAQERLQGLAFCSFRPFYLKYKVLDGALVIRVEDSADGPVLVGGMADC